MTAKSITAAEYHKDRPLSGLAQLAEMAARNSLPDSPYSPWARQQFERLADLIRLRMLARLRPSFHATAAW